jgi:omega-6 fatty acid desaturase (delta-12 desaturase)
VQITESISELRAGIRPLRAKSLRLALTIFVGDTVFYGLATWLAITAPTAALGWLYGSLAGVGIAMLFVVGHDACHGSFTASKRWNGWIGRIAFLPSLTPFAAWEIGHNQTHHVYTNLKGKDYVWAPFSKAEFDALPGTRRFLERCYRTPLGVGLNYGIEIWWKRLFFALRQDPSRAREVLADSLMCSAYALALAGGALAVGVRPLLAGVIWPLLIWNWTMGWAIFEHHTHPRVPWFGREAEWRAASAQSRCTVHAVLPKALDLVIHNIMQHTAHHLDVTIPLYHLGEAQTVVESSSEAIAVVERWTPGRFFRHLRACRLYDFDRHQWLDFDGRPTAPPIEFS